MIAKRLLLLLAAALALATAAHANFVVEPGYEKLFAEADLVAIGTVTGIRPRSGQVGPTATLSVSNTLKGQAGPTITVRTDSRIAELNPRCCDMGATYLMFLGRSRETGELMSIWGAYGMVRIAGPPGRIVVIPCRDRSRRGRANDKGPRIDCP